MPVSGIDHINIRTTDVAASAQFYVDVFELKYFNGPSDVKGFDRNWLFDSQGQAIIHFRVFEPGAEATGPIDHIALKCAGKDAIMERLKIRNVEFSKFENPVSGITQIFIKDPHGVPLELNFAAD